MRAWIKDFFCFGAITILVSIYFLRLFYPTVQLIMTPDFRRSDAWSFSFSTKYILSTHLKNNQLPWWTDTLAGGFPLIAEGQIGAFYAPNLVAFRLFDPVIAYNLMLLWSVLTIGWGTYIWFRVEKMSRVAGLFGAITICFSGLVIPHLTHIALLQAFSLLPWIMACIVLMATKQTKWASILFIFFSSQQLFAGFPQAAFLTHFFGLPYYVFLLYQHKRSVFHGIGRIILCYLLVFGLSAIQLVPSAEFLKQTVYPKGMPLELASLYSYPMRSLKLFLHPFLLGNPMLGTYQKFSSASASIFWETNGYIGMIPLMLMSWASSIAIRKKRYPPMSVFLCITCVVALLLAGGKYSPLYFFYSFWPLNFFRVPARFIWIFTYIFIFIAASALSDISHRLLRVRTGYIVLITILIAHTATLWFVWNPYHMYVNAKTWMEKPIFVQSISEDSTMYAIETDHAYFDEFHNGWKNPKPYQFLQQAIPSNGNAIWDIKSYDVATGRDLRRQALVGSMILEGIRADDNIATISGLTQKMLQLYGVDQIISAKEIRSEDNTYTQVSQLKSNDTSIALYHYASRQSTPKAYFANDTHIAKTAEDANTIIRSDAFTIGNSVLLETENETSIPSSLPTPVIIKTTPNALTIRVSDLKKSAYLVTRIPYYPGWHAYVDQIEHRILPANIAQQSILVPPGNHTIQFVYAPSSIRTGAIITAISGLIMLGLVASLLAPFFLHTHQRRSLPLRRRQSNRGT